MRADDGHQRMIMRGGPDSFHNNPSFSRDGTGVS
jgi:hypothetical protein